jgi:hypothetical protein
MIPPTFYTYNLLNYTLYNIPLDNFIIQNFIYEWSLVTPLIVLNITTTSKVKPYKQIIMCFLTLAMNICGFLFYKMQNNGLVYFIIGSICLIILYLCIGWIFYKRKWVIYRDNPLYNKYVKFINTSFYIVISSWSLFPVVMFLFVFSILDIYATVICFMILDFFSKGLLVMNTVRNNNILYYTDSFRNQILQQSSNQIVPLNNTFTNQIVETSTQIVPLNDTERITIEYI